MEIAIPDAGIKDIIFFKPVRVSGVWISFGEKFDFEGKEFKPTMKYNLLGTTINYFLENSILDIPDYIKIDVDGIEHLILEGGDKFLNCLLYTSDAADE